MSQECHNAEQVKSDEREADGKTGETDRSALLRDAEYAHEEQESPNDLVGEGSPDVILAEIAGAPAILTETARPARRLACQNEIEHSRACDRAQNLRDNINDKVPDRHAARHEGAKTHRRIDMASRDLPNAIGHGHDRQSEGRSDAKNVDGSRTRAHACDYRRAAAGTSANVPMNSATAFFTICLLQRLRVICQQTDLAFKRSRPAELCFPTRCGRRDTAGRAIR